MQVPTAAAEVMARAFGASTVYPQSRAVGSHRIERANLHLTEALARSSLRRVSFRSERVLWDSCATPPAMRGSGLPRARVRASGTRL